MLRDSPLLCSTLRSEKENLTTQEKMVQYH
jgi:hypothetical protein